jgi:hypothetical protein
LTIPAKNVFLKLSSETTQSERKKVKNKTLLFCPEGSMEYYNRCQSVTCWLLSAAAAATTLTQLFFTQTNRQINNYPDTVVIRT